MNIRNFCIIAHIDHGKSTLADRLLEVTGTVSKREMKAQLLDQMELERERGITIKLQPVRMEYKSKKDKKEYVFNLIDTPGHVDFTYEVSRSLAAVEGAVLLVDASQGVQAQTLANLYLALDQDLEIIPVMNKIDLPNSDPEKTRKEIVSLLGCKPEDVLSVSAKTGEGVEELLEVIADRVPGPDDVSKSGMQALIFDSVYDEYKGVVAYVRIVSGHVKRGDKVTFIGTNKKTESLEVGHFKPQKVKTKELYSGEIGYIVTGLKSVSGCKVGDTITLTSHPSKPLAGYEEVKPMVYAGVFCRDGDQYPRLRDAIEKIHLTDSSLTYEPDNSSVLGFGFRCGFLGLLHLDVIQERLRREFSLDLIVTTPSVAYSIFLNSELEPQTIHSAQGFPEVTRIERVEEPWAALDIVTRSEYLGPIMDFTTKSRGIYRTTEYLDQDRLILHFELPLASILVDFYDKLKSVSSGYASMNYSVIGYRPAEVVKMNILVAEEPVSALSMIVYRDEADTIGRKVVKTLKEVLPKQQYVLKIQAAIGGKIVASERLSALRKDVTAKLYGGDVTRKRKLLEKQKKGKKRMMKQGSVDIPTKAYLAVLRRD